MPTITIRNIDDKAARKLRDLAKEQGIPYNSVEELLRREIARLTSDDAPRLPIALYMTKALPYHYVAERADGSRWLILATATGARAWDDAREYKGSYDLVRVPDYIAKMYLPGEA